MKRSWWLQFYKSISLASSKNKGQKEKLTFIVHCVLNSLRILFPSVHPISYSLLLLLNYWWRNLPWIATVVVVTSDQILDIFWRYSQKICWQIGCGCEKRGLKDDTRVIGLKNLLWQCCHLLKWRGCEKNRFGERSEIQFWSVKLEMSIRLLNEMLSMQLDLSLAGGDQIWTLSADRQYSKT